MNENIIRLAKYLYYYMPSFFKKKLAHYKEEKNLKESLKRSQRTKVSKDEIVDAIKSLGLGKSDIILHTSMMSIGKLQGGIKWVTKCLLDETDITQHTVLVSALPYRGKFKNYLEDSPIFDVRTAPIAMGGINEYIGSLPNSYRSIHPTHSIIAIGKDADFYVKDHFKDITPFGPNSPYFKIIKNRGKAVMFGASLNYFTCIHAIEDMLGNAHPFKIYDDTIYEVKCFDKDGRFILVKTSCHDSLHSYIRMMLPLKEGLVKNGIMSITPIGESEIEVVDLYEFTMYYLEELLKGRSIYGKFKVTNKLVEKVNHIKLTL